MQTTSGHPPGAAVVTAAGVPLEQHAVFRIQRQAVAARRNTSHARHVVKVREHGQPAEQIAVRECLNDRHAWTSLRNERPPTCSYVPTVGSVDTSSSDAADASILNRRKPLRS